MTLCSTALPETPNTLTSLVTSAASGAVEQLLLLVLVPLYLLSELLLIALKLLRRVNNLV